MTAPADPPQLLAPPHLDIGARSNRSAIEVLVRPLSRTSAAHQNSH
ncbi:MAG: hypothetical protein QOE19_3865, partial [Actinomycetota bacterium]|nr:hypothetical protein [Actinomycetota bacterium]